MDLPQHSRERRAAEEPVHGISEDERNALVNSVVKGDQDALQRLIVHYHATLRGVVATSIDASQRRHIDPDDVLQQAYVSAFKNIAGNHFDGPGHFYAWLKQIALNQLKDVQRALKRQKRDIARELPDHPDLTESYSDMVERLAARDPTPSRQIAKDEAVAAVMTCLARLTDDQREVVRLRILEDVPVTEIAGRLGKSDVAIYALCRRALKSLHELMGPITHYLTKL